MNHRNLALLVVGLFVALLTVAVPTHANGVPVQVFLTYLPDLSNYGPQDATGEAWVSTENATIELTASGLPQLEGEHYEVWLMSADQTEMVSMGTFNADANGQVEFSNELEEDLPEPEYRYIVLSVEPEPDTSEEADARRSIAGVFPNEEVVATGGSPTPTLEPGVTPSPGAPTTLPTTGEQMTWVWALLGLLVLAVPLMVVLRGRTSKP